jgi:hypothetical protein
VPDRLPAAPGSRVMTALGPPPVTGSDPTHESLVEFFTEAVQVIFLVEPGHAGHAVGSGH